MQNLVLWSQCQSNGDGGAVFANLRTGGKLTITGSCSFTDCKALSNTGFGGNIYAYFESENCSLTFEDSITFENCSAQYGGGMYMNILNNGLFTMTGSCLLKNCNCTQYGGGCYIYGQSSALITIKDMRFANCNSTNSGGGLYISGNTSALITIKDISFSNCNATDFGGGFYSSLSSEAQLTITDQVVFTNCRASSGGGSFLYISSSDTNINITGELEYKECASIFGGGLCITVEDRSTVEINKASFIDCLSGYAGGGLYIQTRTGGQFAITGTALFLDCNSSNKGGGLYLETNNGTVNFNPTEQILIENCNGQDQGGGIYCLISSNGLNQVNNMKLSNCISQGNGGGIYAIIESGGQLILDKSSEFYQLESRGNGGGIYVDIDSTTQCSFIIKDAYIHECKSLINTSLSYPESGFGGGLFLGGSGDYNPISKLIDLHGMKIYNNSADKYGQSLYVIIPQGAELCKYGILGEYVKGNYSDTYSDESDLEGIPMNLTTFNTSNQTQIKTQVKPLELYWRVLGILKSASVIVNVSNPNGKLMFHIEGQRMFQGYLNVKIFELRNKTKEEIDQEQKEIKYKHNKNNFISLKRNSLQSQIPPKHKNNNHQQISIYTNHKIGKKTQNQANEIIYPPEDGSSAPIQIDGEIYQDQNATFRMNEYKWLNYKQKEYGVLISNDRNIFTGIEGNDYEEDENAAVQLEVIIQDDVEKEDEQEKDEEGKGFPIGVIVGIAVGALAIVAVIIIIIIVAVFISKKTAHNGLAQLQTVT
ncbi:MAG: hypothetical protein EZS28_010935 [Streblomastix strix]|uniref:Right handed beta helix domain-containing protein n=1 Tax=Streblomastix strix TaxID=222440 RepID=A0A5J4WF50_9EUKA|nr:MAG: hypothetical protein EZS28_010935 [Streblomastix strix]